MLRWFLKIAGHHNFQEHVKPHAPNHHNFNALARIKQHFTALKTPIFIHTFSKAAFFEVFFPQNAFKAVEKLLLLG
jgi:hypothetical protein